MLILPVLVFVSHTGSKNAVFVRQATIRFSIIERTARLLVFLLRGVVNKRGVDCVLEFLKSDKQIYTYSHFEPLGEKFVLYCMSVSL